MLQTAWGGRRSATSLRSAQFATPLVSCCYHMEAHNLRAYHPTLRVVVTHTQMWPEIKRGLVKDWGPHSVSESILTLRCNAARQGAPRHPVPVEWYRTALDKGTPVAAATWPGGGDGRGGDGSIHRIGRPATLCGASKDEIQCNRNTIASAARVWDGSRMQDPSSNTRASIVRRTSRGLI